MSLEQILIIGAGIGGLTCAISCRKAGLRVTVLEQSKVVSEIGAGIQIPPNATRVLTSLGVFPAIQAKGNRMVMLDIRRYSDSKILFPKVLTDECIKDYGAEWWNIHRADYHGVLLNEARRLGVRILLDSRVVSVDVAQTKVVLEHNQSMSASVIIGADGLWSTTRQSLADTPSPPYETGDLAYRATIPCAALVSLNDPRINDLIQNTELTTLWAGPGRHCVMYSLRSGSVFNLVMVRPDNMPPGSKTLDGDIGEMRESFDGWDPVLTKIISCVPTVLKWKLLHADELRPWVKNCTTILGDACHPTLPYQGQGGAMAVEDAALLGYFLGQYHMSVRPITGTNDALLSSLLTLYEEMRRPRTTLNVKGAVSNREFFHMENGPEQEARDRLGDGFDPRTAVSRYAWVDSGYQRDLLGYDVLADGEEAFRGWFTKNVGPAEEEVYNPRL